MYNVQKLVTEKHLSMIAQNKMNLWVMALATKNRVAYMYNGDESLPQQASSIPLETFCDELRYRRECDKYMLIIIKCILIKSIPFFKVKEFIISHHDITSTAFYT